MSLFPFISVLSLFLLSLSLSLFVCHNYKLENYLLICGWGGFFFGRQGWNAISINKREILSFPPCFCLLFMYLLAACTYIHTYIYIFIYVI